MKTLKILFVFLFITGYSFQVSAQTNDEWSVVGEFVEILGEMNTHFVKFKGEVYSDKGGTKQYMSTYNHKGAVTAMITHKSKSSSYGIFYDLSQKDPSFQKEILADYVAIFLHLEKSGFKMEYDSKKIQDGDYTVMRLLDEDGNTFTELNINETEFMVVFYYYE
ncbi:MAG: hypothetical protein RBT46_00130 [Weeksellaceae bacterium]|jgi:hypothetical protein|nr:hypothetical protein [Weeksellaceae bacterium]MDX9704099.1 hypothetical protein [Weeksellaceae bacterium]